MSEKNNLSLFEDFFESPSPADYAKMLINIENSDENKEIVAAIKDRISDLKERIKEMSETEKKMLMRHQGLLKKFLITIKMLKKNVQLASKIDKGKSKAEESIAERTKLRRERIVYSIKEILDKIQKNNKSANKYVIQGNEKIINIAEYILYLNQLEQQKGRGLKILTPNQMLSRLSISLAQLKAGNNSEKLKNQIRQLLYSLYRSKKLTT